MKSIAGIDPSAKPSGDGCAECTAHNGWWLHLRRCAQCGHIGCCDSSPHQHATAHFHATNHPIMASYEPGEEWFWNYNDESYINGPHLAEPRWHPADQPAPGPEGRVPANWQSLLK
jgi:hypothetical protein